MATGRVPTTANSPLTAKGDLFGYSTTQARVPVGNDGETIVADSSTSTGLRYTAGTVQANPTLNSAMQIWQRGTSIAITTSAYLADRWQGYRAVAGSTASRQATNDSTNLPFIQYCARVQRDSGNSALNPIFFAQTYETANSIPFAGKTVTMSFYARAGANYSSASSILGVQLYTGTGTDQNYITSFTGGTNAINTNSTLTTTWQRFTYTATLGATVSQLAVAFNYTPVGTAGAADFFEVTGVQIDIGSVALPFRTYAGTIQGELAACQRYYASWNRDAAVSDAGLCVGFASSTTSGRFYLALPVVMRTTPTVLDFSNIQVNSIGGAFNTTALTFTGAVNNKNTAVMTATVASGLTANVPFFLNVSSSGYLGIGAEL